MACLLLAQISLADLEKAHGKVASAAKRWLRTPHAGDEHSPVDITRQCPSCGLLLLGHPLDTIAGRSKMNAGRHSQGSPSVCKAKGNSAVVGWEGEPAFMLIFGPNTCYYGRRVPPGVVIGI